MKKSRLTLAALFVFVCCRSSTAAPTLTLDPVGGAVSGAPGSIVGWGFSLVNDTGFSLFVDAPSAFCESGQDPAFTTCTQLGASVYTDYIIGEVIQPNSTFTAVFDAGMMTGIGQYQIDAAETPGTVDSGSIFVTYAEYNGDPLNGGTQVSGDIEVSTAASVTATGITATPEPATAGLIGFLLLAMLALPRALAAR